MGEEVEALSYKTDVGARLDDYVDEKKEAVTSKVKGATDAAASAAGTVVPSKQRLRSVKNTAERNPLGLAVGGAAVGFVVGLLLPSTRVEDEQIGDMATRLKDTAKETGQEALDRGMAVAQSAMETAREEGGQQGRELAGDLKERVQPDTEGKHLAS
ncbi:MAG TPA: YtxH domain-containing protein [Gaiella sp.]|uniref:YtxH domain-containing protein n=1 Tax=Gaiella sp. TaxID=2663207 RepID=UPI002D7E2DB5|nr:YtxH domain-containing protein [Gaiella sp.]HET9288834.1 YtxH domain-containing protein [Gaiella sp.]